MIPGVLDIEDLGKPRVGQPARCARGRHDVADSGKSRGEREDGDSPGERLVDGLPRIPARARGDPVFQPVTPAEPGAWRGRIHGHRSIAPSQVRLSTLPPGTGSWAGGLDNSMMRHNMPGCSAATLPLTKPLPTGNHKPRCSNAGRHRPPHTFTGGAATAQCQSGP